MKMKLDTAGPICPCEVLETPPMRLKQAPMVPIAMQPLRRFRQKQQLSTRHMVNAGLQHQQCLKRSSTELRRIGGKRRSRSICNTHPPHPKKRERS